MSGKSFFEEPEPQSILKAELVKRYFQRWAGVMLAHVKGPDPRIAYVDLFSGPGRFANGQPSTPLLLLNHAVADPRLCDRLVTTFSDREPEFVRILEEEIRQIPNIGRMRYRPQVVNYSVGRDLVETIRATQLVPTLFFIDPWGYKGLSLDLVAGAIKN